MSTVFNDNHNWKCLKHKGCLFSILCDCRNCILFESILKNSINKEKSKYSTNLHPKYPDKTFDHLHH